MFPKPLYYGPPPGQFLFGNKNLENVLSFCCQKKIGQGGSLGKWFGEHTPHLLYFKFNLFYN